MKTIAVVFTNTLVPPDNNLKRYSFNTEANVSVGDMFKLLEYNTPIQVVGIHDKHYIYYNPKTGVLADDFVSSDFWKIRELQLIDKPNNCTYGYKL